MASSVQVDAERAARPPRAATRGVLAGWHLFSLDAPTVAAVWTWFVARAVGVELPWTEITGMFCAVWVLYATDRLLDARALERGGDLRQLEARHFFHFVHRRWFVGGIAAGCVALAVLLPAMTVAELRLYAVLGAMLAVWFALIHCTMRSLPKELAVGVFFAVAVFIPAMVLAPGMRGELAVAAVSFGGLCWLNCLFIAAWEHEGRPDARVVAWAGCGLGALALGLTPFVGVEIREILASVALSCGWLLGVHLVHRRIERTALRALADLVLLTPVLMSLLR